MTYYCGLLDQARPNTARTSPSPDGDLASRPNRSDTLEHIRNPASSRHHRLLSRARGPAVKLGIRNRKVVDRIIGPRLDKLFRTKLPRAKGGDVHKIRGGEIGPATIIELSLRCPSWWSATWKEKITVTDD